MANIKSAKKRAKQSEKRRQKNLTRLSDIKTAQKKVLDALEKNDLTRAKELFKDVEAKLARAKSKKVLHSNTTSRKISSLAKKISAAERAIL